MPGGLIQLVAIGAQDVVLTGEPEITFFSALYRPYVNFAIESIAQTFSGTPDFGNRVTFDLSRSGDLITNVLLEVVLPQVSVQGQNPTFQWSPKIGNTLIRDVSIEIGGSTIDKQFGLFYNVWNELTLPEEKREGYNTMVGQQNLRYNQTDPSDIVVFTDGPQTPLAVQPELLLQVPLFFWFCNNSGLALPIIALQFHNIRFQFSFRSFNELHRLTGTNVTFVGGTPSIQSAQVWVDYIYLDNKERKNFAKAPHEYLITQLQELVEGVSQSQSNVRLNFNHPTKELIWVVQEDQAVASNVNDWTNWEVVNPVNPGVSVGDNPLNDALIKLNNTERFARRRGEYFNLVQPYYHHSRVPSSKGVFTYSFALNPEEYQPSGTANFSRIDNATLELNLKNITSQNAGKVYVWAINYNLFRVANGMGGIAYAS
jgi:hypothetical protein